jgi:hypothetical protein
MFLLFKTKDSQILINADSIEAIENVKDGVHIFIKNSEDYYLVFDTFQEILEQLIMVRKYDKI